MYFCVSCICFSTHFPAISITHFQHRLLIIQLFSPIFAHFSMNEKVFAAKFVTRKQNGARQTSWFSQIQTLHGDILHSKKKNNKKENASKNPMFTKKYLPPFSTTFVQFGAKIEFSSCTSLKVCSDELTAIFFNFTESVHIYEYIHTYEGMF